MGPSDTQVPCEVELEGRREDRGSVLRKRHWGPCTGQGWLAGGQAGAAAQHRTGMKHGCS